MLLLIGLLITLGVVGVLNTYEDLQSSLIYFRFICFTFVFLRI